MKIFQNPEMQDNNGLKKADQNVLFPDLPELDDKQEIQKDDKEDVKIIQLEEDVPPTPTKDTKKIIIDPKYVAKDS